MADQIDQTTSSITVTVTVEDAAAESFKRNMMGYSIVGGDGKLRRRLPEVAKWGNFRDHYCVKLDPVFKTPLYTDGVLQLNSDGWPQFDIAKYRATFVVPLYTIMSDDERDSERERFCVWRRKTTAQNEKIPGGGFYWVDAVAANRTPVPEVGVRVGRQTELTCKWLDVPQVDHETLTSYCNKVNDSAFEMDGTVYPTESVLLTGYDAEPKINGNRDKSYDITFTFAVRSDGRTWNKFWKSGASGYVEISSDGTTGGDKVFETLTFDLLWIL
jgi:hypothetical protein